MRQKLLIAGVLVSLSVMVGDVTRGQAASVDGVKLRKFTLIAPDTEQTNVDAGKPGPSQGDLFIFSGPLLDARGATRGRLDGHCVTVSLS